ncbi:MAG: hypothetical protein JW821_17565 [Deltaproteobacteria bacterium]|nr:hypothetical protein [Deltaproteobacteria bacterium]
MFESLQLSELSVRQCGMIRTPTRTRPALRIVEEDGVKAVVKDYSANGVFYRNTVGRFLVWREYRAYRRLRGLKGVPSLYRVIKGLAMVIERIPGRPMEGLEGERRLAPEFFDDLRVLVSDIHNRGIAHCDLKRAPNVILGEDGRPYIVDWSASILQREFGFYPASLIYERFVADDFNGVTKLQLRHCPEAIRSEDRKRFAHRSRAENMVRAFRDRARTLLQRIA